MKTKSLVLAALIGAAAVSANAGVSFGLSIGVPLPVVVTTLVALVETVPACPGVDYVWAPGYWSYRTGHLLGFEAPGAIVQSMSCVDIITAGIADKMQAVTMAAVS